MKYKVSVIKKIAFLVMTRLVIRTAHLLCVSTSRTSTRCSSILSLRRMQRSQRPPVTDGVLKVTAVKDGNTTITVTAADDEGSMTAVDDFSVTVAKTNAAPTTHGLSITDTTALQKKLYYRDGARTHNVTVVSDAGCCNGCCSGYGFNSH